MSGSECRTLAQDDLVLVLNREGLVLDALGAACPFLEQPEAGGVIGLSIMEVLPAGCGRRIADYIRNFNGSEMRRHRLSDSVLRHGVEFTLAVEILASSSLSEASSFIVTLNQLEAERDTPFDSIARNRLLFAVTNASRELYGRLELVDAIQAALGHLGMALGVDRACLKTVHGASSCTEISCVLRAQWALEMDVEVSATVDAEPEPLSQYRGFCRDLLNGSVAKGIVSGLSDPVSRCFLESRSVQSILLCPLLVQESLWGFVCFEDRTFKRKWTGVEVGILGSFVGMIQQRLVRGEAQMLLHEGYCAAPGIEEVRACLLS
ncbi:MAG: hypothetical protein H7A07_02180 [Pseudomonadales bacterium]|nr:hypothetical protein [Pseudomonadales bacterium]